MKYSRVYIEQTYQLQRATQDNTMQNSRSGLSKNVSLSFQNIVYSVNILNPSNRSTDQKQVIKGVTGYCPGGQVTAILGSSGAGKTTLLNILACRVQKSSNSQFEGQIYANGQEYDMDKFSSFSSYVMQNDILLETMTPREAFQFVANLKYRNKETLELRVSETIKSMKLEKCQNTLIGGITLKGISGGEKKRTSIGFELVSNPSCLLLDEPTSGLDSFTAYQIINELRQLAQKQLKTIVLTIHSPSTDILLMLDRIILMIEGKFVYQGEQSEMINYFTKIGFACPISSNPMDYYIGLMNPQNSDYFPDQLKMLKSYENICHPQVLQKISKIEEFSLPIREQATPFLNQVIVIGNRNIRGSIRDPLQLWIRFFQAVTQGLLQGGVFWNIGNSSDYLQISGCNMLVFIQALFFAVMNLVISAVLSIILSFPTEREVFLREESSKIYTLFSYFIGKQILEIPLCILIPVIQESIAYWMCSYQNNTTAIFLHLLISILIYSFANGIGLLFGCIFEDIQAILGIAPYTILPYLLFAGYFSNPKFFYSWTKWLQYVSPMTYGFESLSRVEFKNSDFEQMSIDFYEFKFGTSTCIYALIAFVIFYRLVAYSSLYILKKHL